MGLQQFFLLFLVVGVVGAGIYVGVYTFTESAVQKNHEALIQDAIRIANDVQEWKAKPASFDGQASCASEAVIDDVNDFTCANFPRLGYLPTATGPNEYATLNGVFWMNVVNQDSTAIVAVNMRRNNKVVIGITGTTAADISTTTLCRGGVDGEESPCAPVRLR